MSGDMTSSWLNGKTANIQMRYQRGLIIRRHVLDKQIAFGYSDDWFI